MTKTTWLFLHLRPVHSREDYSPAIILEELTGVELAAIPPGVAPLPWSLTMGSGNTSGFEKLVNQIHVLTRIESHRRRRQGDNTQRTYRSRDDPWPLWPWDGLGGRSAAVCPGSLKPLCWPGAGSRCAQTSPTFCGSVWRTNQGQSYIVRYSWAKIGLKIYNEIEVIQPKCFTFPECHWTVDPIQCCTCRCSRTGPLCRVLLRSAPAEIQKTQISKFLKIHTDICWIPRGIFRGMNLYEVYTYIYMLWQ